MFLLLLPLWLHKTLPIPFLPLGFCILLGGLGLLLKKRWITVLAFGMLWGCSTQPVATGLIASLELRYPAMEVTNCPAADAIVVLCGMLSESVTSATEWNRSVDRFERGVELVKAGRAPYLVFTRGMTWSAVSRESEGERLMREAVRHGVPAEQLALTDAPVVETSGEVKSIRQAMLKHGWHKIIFVTSAEHMPRAMWLIEQQGIDAIPFPADYEAKRRRPIDLQSLLPQAEYLDMSERAIRERLGLAYYRVFGI